MICYIFCDETCLSDRHLLLGGIVTGNEWYTNLLADLLKLRDETGMHAELKWSKVSRGRLDAYKAFVDVFFRYIDADEVHFSCITFDSTKFKHWKYNAGNKELGFYKFYYQLIHHRFGRYARNGACPRFIVHLDQRDSSYSLDTLRDVLNNGYCKDGSATVGPYAKIAPLNSKKNTVLQVVDVVLGAVGFHKNGKDGIPGASKAKIELANYIAGKAGKRRLDDASAFGKNRFNVWHFQLRA